MVGIFFIPVIHKKGRENRSFHPMKIPESTCGPIGVEDSYGIPVRHSKHIEPPKYELFGPLV
jgi:hypothetical protein